MSCLRFFLSPRGCCFDDVNTILCPENSVYLPTIQHDGALELRPRPKRTCNTSNLILKMLVFMPLCAVHDEPPTDARGTSMTIVA